MFILNFFEVLGASNSDNGIPVEQSTDRRKKFSKKTFFNAQEPSPCCNFEKVWNLWKVFAGNSSPNFFN